jgi:hypothetical protein
MRHSNQQSHHGSIAQRLTPSSTMILSVLVAPFRPLLRCLRKRSMPRPQCHIDSRLLLYLLCPKWHPSPLYPSTFTRAMPLHSYRICSPLLVIVFLQSHSRLASHLNLLAPALNQAPVTAQLRPHLVQSCLFPLVWACRLVHILLRSRPVLVPPSILRLISVCLQCLSSLPLDCHTDKLLRHTTIPTHNTHNNHPTILNNNPNRHIHPARLIREVTSCHPSRLLLRTLAGCTICLSSRSRIRLAVYHLRQSVRTFRPRTHPTRHTHIQDLQTLAGRHLSIPWIF